MTLTLSGCAASWPTERPSSVGKYVAGDRNSKSVFVFVHGLFGDPLESWRNENGRYFFELMADDFPPKDYAVYVFGYPSTAFGPAFTITEAAQLLYSRLDVDQILRNHQKAFFVTHSMGGLVVQQFLLTYHFDPNRVPLLFEFATPHEGSDIANIARHVARNAALDTLVTGDKNQYLQDLDVRWKAAVTNGSLSATIRCAHETLDTFGIRIVGVWSATRGCEASLPVAADHIGIIKPPDQQHDSYVALKRAVADAESGKRTPDDTAREKALDKAGRIHIVRFQLVPLQEQGQALMNIYFRNIGGAKAEVRSYSVTQVVSSTEESAETMKREREFYEALPKAIAADGAVSAEISPSASGPLPWFTHFGPAVPEDTARLILESKYRLYFVGVIEYRTGGKTRYTTYCLYTHGDPSVWFLCHKFNEEHLEHL